MSNPDTIRKGDRQQGRVHIKRYKGGWGWFYNSTDNVSGWQDNWACGSCIMAVAEGYPMDYEEDPKDALYDEGLYTDFRFESIIAFDKSEATNTQKAAIVQLANRLDLQLIIHPYHEKIST